MKSLKNLSLMEKIGAFVIGFIVIGIIFYGIKSLSKGYLASFGEYFIYWGLGLVILLVLFLVIYFLIIKFKKWKSLSLWLKSGVIGVGIYLIIILVPLSLKSVLKEYWGLPLIPVAYLFRYRFGGGPHNDILNISLIIIISSIFVFLIGALIGLLIQKLRK